MSELTPEQMAAIAHTNLIKNQIDNKHIVPSLKTQIYAMGEFRDLYGEEVMAMGAYDTEKRSTFTVTSNNPVTYGWEEVESTDIPEGTTPTEVETLPEATSSNAGSYVSMGTDPNTKYYKCMTYGEANINHLVSTDSVKVVITLNQAMLAINPKPNIIVDGKEYTSAIAGTEIVFYMNRDHRISILWASPDTIETFLVIANR